MPIWRAPDLEATLGTPIDAASLTEAVLDHLVTASARESEQLDFKKPLSASVRVDPSKPPDWSAEQEFAKDVAALANHRGGLLILGVEDVNCVATALRQYEATSSELEERRLRQALSNYVAPTVHTVYVPVSAATGGFYLIIVVPPSARAPHAVLGNPGDGRRPLRYPLRHDADTLWLTESEVADRYRRRAELQVAGAAHTDAVVQDGCRVLRRADGVWLYAAAVPDVPLVADLDATAVEAAREWRNRTALNSPLQRSLVTYGAPIPGPGKTTFTGNRRYDHEEDADPRDAYVELHVDGCAFAATPVMANTSEEEQGGVGELTLADDAILVVDVVLGWADHQAGSGGATRVVSGLLDCASGDPELLTAPVGLVAVDFGRRTQPRGTRRLERAPRVTTSAIAGDPGDVQGRLAVTGRVLALLLQWFGRAESRQVAADGALLLSGWRQEQHVARWARDHGVATRDR